MQVFHYELWPVVIALLIDNENYYFKAVHQNKACRCECWSKADVNGCNVASLSDHGVLEGDHISPLNSRRQAL